MKKVLSIAIFIALNQLNAQPFYQHWDFTVGLGTSNYSGEIANESTVRTITSEIRPQMSLELNYNLSPTNTIGLEGVFGSWYANDKNHQNRYDRFYEGSSKYAYLGLQFNHFFFAQKNWLLTPYLGAGLGYNFYHTEISALEEARTIPTPDQADVKSQAFGFTFTGGAIYDVNHRLSLSLEYWLSLYGSDMIDNLVYAKKETDKIGSIRIKAHIRLFRS
ncbi:MAG: DUF6089 family protein [Schleiferiaceae bacterium]|jgi:opacity protein-like surface antigen|nr:DUF6089 family protein [Schleiferiaceae bacterium]